MQRAAGNRTTGLRGKLSRAIWDHMLTVIDNGFAGESGNQPVVPGAKKPGSWGS